DGSAREVLTMLLAECATARVDLCTGMQINAVIIDGFFRVETPRGNFSAPTLVLASGGLSIPKIGASGFAYDLARRFGLRLIEPRPGLVPFRLAGKELEFANPLSGNAVEAEVRCGRQKFRENVLFTHRGLSGPAILQISSYWRDGDTLSLNLAPSLDIEDFLADRKRARPK